MEEKLEQYENYQISNLEEILFDPKHLENIDNLKLFFKKLFDQILIFVYEGL